jgi:hypothetical protein
MKFFRDIVNWSKIVVILRDFDGQQSSDRQSSELITPASGHARRQQPQKIQPRKVDAAPAPAKMRSATENLLAVASSLKKDCLEKWTPRRHPQKWTHLVLESFGKKFRGLSSDRVNQRVEGLNIGSIPHNTCHLPRSPLYPNTILQQPSEGESCHPCLLVSCPSMP